MFNIVWYENTKKPAGKTTNQPKKKQGKKYPIYIPINNENSLSNYRLTKNLINK